MSEGALFLPGAQHLPFDPVPRYYVGQTVGSACRSASLESLPSWRLVAIEDGRPRSAVKSAIDMRIGGLDEVDTARYHAALITDAALCLAVLLRRRPTSLGDLSCASSVQATLEVVEESLACVHQELPYGG